MKCCPHCFDDRGLSEQIFPTLANETGTCSFCETQSQLLLSPSALNDYFGALINIYEPKEDGKLLVQLLREDWSMFENPKMDEHRAKSLLAEILGNGEIVRQNFAPSERYQSDGLNRWENLRSELMSQNRYFPKAQLDTERLEQLLTHLAARDLPGQWFRARIQREEQAFSLEYMGAPPARDSSHGRANPPGIPYLYLGSENDTAICEIRPHTGEWVSVARFSLPKDLHIVDLQNPRKLVSPFLLADEREIGMMRCDVAFLDRLGAELTRPVLPHSAAIDYVPSQYLCEFIKKCGYDGVSYSSSVSKGINLALFDPSKATGIDVKRHLVERVSVTIADG